jgi:hypothetical protein
MLPSSTLNLFLLSHSIVSSWRKEFVVIARIDVVSGIVDMCPPHLVPHPSPDVSKVTRQKKLAVAKKC